MRKYLIVGLFTVIYSINCFGLNAHLVSIQHDLVAQRYQDAKNELQSILSNNPSDFEALYLQLAVWQTEILDYESYYINGKQFISTADSIREVLEKRLQTLHGRDSVMCLFYLANVYGGIGVIEAKTGDWLEGARNGMTSNSLCKQVQKYAPDFVAANLGVGLFSYYFSSSFNWLPFTGGRAEEGLNYIEEAATKSDFPFNYAAKNSLCWILIDRQEYSKADSIALSVLNEYPGNTIFLRIRSIIDLRTGAYKNAIVHANQLLSLTKERFPRNWSDLVAAYYILVESYHMSGLVSESIVAADTILSESIPETYLSIPHIRKNLKRIRDIKEKTCAK